jgi:hypothetical protein
MTVSADCVVGGEGFEPPRIRPFSSGSVWTCSGFLRDSNCIQTPTIAHTCVDGRIWFGHWLGTGAVA